jgi:hypothetical protein
MAAGGIIPHIEPLCEFPAAPPEVSFYFPNNKI